MKYRTEIFQDKHLKYLEDWLEFFQRKGWKNNYNIKGFRLDRLKRAYISFYNDKFLGFSGLEDISEWLPDTYRIFTRNVSTNACDEKWIGRGPENVFYNCRLHAPLQILYAKSKKPNYNIVMSCNAEVTEKAGVDSSFRLARFLNNPRNFSDFYDHKNIRTEEIWYTKQYVYDINCDYVIKLGEDFYGEKLYDYY